MDSAIYSLVLIHSNGAREIKGSNLSLETAQSMLASLMPIPEFTQAVIEPAPQTSGGKRSVDLFPPDVQPRRPS